MPVEMNCIKMKKAGSLFILVISFILSTSFNGFCSDTISLKKSGKGFPEFYIRGLSVDGNPADWPESMFYDNNDAKVLYAVANDSSHMFICIQVMDMSEQMNLVHGGLTIWVDPKGKKKETCAVKYFFQPVKSETDNATRAETVLPPAQGNNPSPNSHANVMQGGSRQLQHGFSKPKPRKFTGTIESSGFVKEYNIEKTAENSDNGFSGALAYDTTGVLIFEAMIPLSAFPVDPRHSKCLSMGFQLNKISIGSGQSNQGEQHKGYSQNGSNGSGGMSGGGMHGGGMGGGMHGGMGGGMGGGGGMHGGGGHGGYSHGNKSDSDNPQNDSKSIKIWHKFSLAPVA